METINRYISALFAKLPATLEILHLKDQVQQDAERAYEASVRAGHSENEALGEVIASLGTIEELLARERGNGACREDPRVGDGADEARAHDDGAHPVGLVELAAERICADVAAEDDGKEVSAGGRGCHGESFVRGFARRPDGRVLAHPIVA